MEGGLEGNTDLGVQGTSRERGRERKGAKQAKNRESLVAGFYWKGQDVEERDLKTFSPFAEVSSAAGISPVTSELLQVFLSSLGLLSPHY